MKRGYQVEGVNVNAQQALPDVLIPVPSWATIPPHGQYREHFGVEALVEPETLPTWVEARAAAHTYFADAVDTESAYVILCKRNDGRVQLWAWYKSGHQKRMWCFGTPRGAA